MSPEVNAIKFIKQKSIKMFFKSQPHDKNYSKEIKSWSFLGNSKQRVKPFVIKKNISNLLAYNLQKFGNL